MKTSYFVCAATAFAAVVGGVSAWPSRIPVSETVRLVPVQPLAESPVIAHPPELPSIVQGPDEVVIPASATVPQPPPAVELPKVPPPPMLPAAPVVPVIPTPPKAVEPQKLPIVPPPPMAQPVPAPLAPPQKLPAVPPPAVLPAPTPFVPPAALGAGSVVLLQDNKLVEGNVTTNGERIVVRRGSIDQPFAKDQVQFIGKSKDECYKHLLGKLKADDAPGRFKLARWCMYNGLREQALVEAQTVVRLQPNHALAAELSRTMEESLRLFNGDGSSKLPPPEVPKPATPKGGEAELDVNAEAATAFGPRVQPVLTNLCADCHAKPSYSGAFKLACGTGTDLDPALTKQNLKAVLGQIKKNDPVASPLLEKSLVAHGGMKQAAFANRMAPAFRVLDAWVVLAAANTGVPVPEAKPEPPKPEAPKPETGKSVLPPPPVVKFAEEARVVVPTAGESGDEFDPAKFNRGEAGAPQQLPPVPPVPGK